MKNLFNVDQKILANYEQVAKAIIDLESEYEKMTDDELKGKTAEFIQKIEAGSTLENIKVEAFATVREAASRALGMKPFKVQLMGAMALLDGNIAEMKTGEGKTLMATLAAYLMSLEKKGVFVVTVNDYLAKRDADEMGVLYNFLDVTVGYSAREMNHEEKKVAYGSDITYVTNNELGFDYLRDNMAMTLEHRVLRSLSNVIIDEVDSILIDEARTPLIISGQEKKTQEVYKQVDAVVKGLKEEEDYVVNEKDKVAVLKNPGIDKVERTFVRGNLFDVRNSTVLHAINNSLKANYCMHKEIDYVVKDGKVIIVDQFTGRLMEGRTFSEGLHQALEAKEHLETQKETKTLATITFQNFFRLFNHISGMTGTAKTVEEEFQKTYGMDVIEIPTNKELIRVDRDDFLFLKEQEKFDYLVKIVKERHAIGQPILIGTVAIETSERIAKALREKGISPVVLNAKHNDVEAEIVKNAGKFGAITIATNMAGRGTDIKIEDKVKELKPFHSELFGEEITPNGLLILGTERHESRRIDDQLRGRSGRQGDAGESIFLVSFEDDLLKRFKNPLLEALLSRTTSSGEPLTDKKLAKSVETIQQQVESINYDIRRNIVKYDDVLRQQREVIYVQRDHILNGNNIISDIERIISDYAKNIVEYYESMGKEDELNDVINATFTTEKVEVSGNYFEEIMKISKKELEFKKELLGEEKFNSFLQTISLKVIDSIWVNHIDEMSTLRNSIGLRGYGQVDPLHEYQREGRQMFETMISSVEEEIIKYILKGKLQTKSQSDSQVNKMMSEHAQVVGEKQETVVNKKKIGRNEKCSCGSGKKYKDCCGK